MKLLIAIGISIALNLAITAVSRIRQMRLLELYFRSHAHAYILFVVWIATGTVPIFIILLFWK